jgi:hypothetical protein
MKGAAAREVPGMPLLGLPRRLAGAVLVLLAALGLRVGQPAGLRLARSAPAPGRHARSPAGGR